MKTIRIDEHNIGSGGRLGRHVEHDDRSRNYAVAAATSTITRVRHRRFGVLDQGQLGSCTGNALAGALNTLPLHVTRTHLKTEDDAVRIYSEATRIDSYPGSYPPDDTGSSGLAVCKAAKNEGLISSYQHAFSLEAALTALMSGPVITGVPWFEGFDTPDAQGRVSISGQIRGGHEFEIIGYQPAASGDLLDGWVIAVNSWGTGWGVNGRFRFTARNWATLLEDNGDVTVPAVPVSA